MVSYLGRPLIARPGFDLGGSGSVVQGRFPRALGLSTGTALPFLGAPIVPVRGQAGRTEECLTMPGHPDEALSWSFFTPVRTMTIRRSVP